MTISRATALCAISSCDLILRSANGGSSGNVSSTGTCFSLRYVIDCSFLCFPSGVVLSSPLTFLVQALGLNCAGPDLPFGYTMTLPSLSIRVPSEIKPMPSIFP
ncbi:hypothetical protein D3C76_687740 [compost metagenome]